MSCLTAGNLDESIYLILPHLGIGIDFGGICYQYLQVFPIFSRETSMPCRIQNELEVMDAKVGMFMGDRNRLQIASVVGIKAENKLTGKKTNNHLGCCMQSCSENNGINQLSTGSGLLPITLSQGRKHFIPCPPCVYHRIPANAMDH